MSRSALSDSVQELVRPAAPPALEHASRPSRSRRANQIAKEELLAFWQKRHRQAGLKVSTSEKVEEIRKERDGVFIVQTSKGQYRAWTVILALGRRGTPRKLDIKGEDSRKSCTA